MLRRKIGRLLFTISQLIRKNALGVVTGYHFCICVCSIWYDIYRVSSSLSKWAATIKSLCPQQRKMAHSATELPWVRTQWIHFDGKMTASPALALILWQPPPSNCSRSPKDVDLNDRHCYTDGVWWKMARRFNWLFFFKIMFLWEANVFFTRKNILQVSWVFLAILLEEPQILPRWLNEPEDFSPRRTT